MLSPLMLIYYYCLHAADDADYFIAFVICITLFIRRYYAAAYELLAPYFIIDIILHALLYSIEYHYFSHFIHIYLLAIAHYFIDIFDTLILFHYYYFTLFFYFMPLVSLRLLPTFIYFDIRLSLFHA